MNRLWVRLTLAFVAVTLVGVATIAVLTDWSAGRGFRQYLARQDALAESGLRDDLAAYYARNGNWNGIEQFLGVRGRGQGQMRGRPGVLLADTDGRIVYDERGARVGQSLTADERAIAVPVAAPDNRTVGYLLATGGPGQGQVQQTGQEFLDELRQTLAIAGLVAGGLSIVLGLVISRMVAAPLANLAQAARAFAARDWNRRVPVKGADEIAAVTREFNAMADTIQRAEALRRNLMADVAHELRTPLTILQGNLRALLDGVYPLELSEIATLYDETRLLSHLVEDLRELALADAGQLQFSVEPVDIEPALRAVVASFAAAADAQGVYFSIDADPHARAEADAARLAQVLRNLVANALRHTPRGGRITISTQAGDDDWLRISVGDTGEGIAAEDLPRVFDRFYRADKSRARESGGSGLGLAIAKAWVEAMGGQIGVESEPGRGTSFWLELREAAIEP
ncbi:MAG: HAMP domain-containing protein [Chloroflexi bacterium]|nr:HAMP domain-containing protein [Chloroflexota bacterium]